MESLDGKVISPYRQKILVLNWNIFLSISLNICFGCSNKPSLLDGSFEYPQRMFWLINKKNNIFEG